MTAQPFSPAAIETFAAAYPEKRQKLTHNLCAHPLLQLDALVELAARMNPADVEYNAGKLPIGVDPADVPTPTLSIMDTIRSIEENGSWMVLKFIENDPQYKALLDKALAPLKEVVEARTGPMLTMQAFAFASATDAVTPFHFDPEHNILLQIRGDKQFTIFDQNDEELASAIAHEQFHMGEHHRNLSWQDRFADRGEAVMLAPGEALHVPVKAPHWVKVVKGPSISLSITWRSEWSYKEADARAMNRLLRKAGVDPATPGRWPNQNGLKSVAYRALRKSGVTNLLG